MTEDHVDVFLASLRRCLAAQDFLRHFYDAFIDSSDEVREKFRRTDFPRQTRVLADSLFVLAVAAQGLPESAARSSLPFLAERHDRAHLDIRPELYDRWLDCMVGTARTHDPDFTPEIEEAWRRTLTVGIEYMRSRY